jgi:hypothetical protein
VLVLVALLHALRSSIAERRDATEAMEVQFDSEWYEPW